MIGKISPEYTDRKKTLKVLYKTEAEKKRTKRKREKIVPERM